MIGDNEIKRLIEEVEEGPLLDYKEDLSLETEGDKAQFVKDILSLANSGGTAHIVCGVEDGTRKLVGIKTHHQVEQLNQILKDKSDPPLRVEYVERRIMGHAAGVIEIIGGNPPYIVAVTDKYGGSLSSEARKKFFIERGTVFVRNFNMNEGAQRADLDKMYKFPYVTLQAELELSHEVSVKLLNDLKRVDIKFYLTNQGDVLATDTYIYLRFKNVSKIEQCKGDWEDLTQTNRNRPTIRLFRTMPIVKPIRTGCSSVVVMVQRDVQQIEAALTMAAANMRTKEGTYVIPLKRGVKIV